MAALLVTEADTSPFEGLIPRLSESVEARSPFFSPSNAYIDALAELDGRDGGLRHGSVGKRSQLMPQCL